MLPGNNSSSSSTKKPQGKKKQRQQHQSSKHKQQQQQQQHKQQQKQKQQLFDPNGTLQVARGLSHEQAQQQYQELQQKLKTAVASDTTVVTTTKGNNHNNNNNHNNDSTIIQQHLWSSTQPVVSQQRLAALQHDDANPKLDMLTPIQQRSLLKRQGQYSSSNNNNNYKKSKNKKLATQLQRHETKRFQAAVAAVDATTILQTDQVGLVETEHDMERTSHLTQAELKRYYLDDTTETTSKKYIYDLQLPVHEAPYGIKYDRSGRYAVLYGRSAGHVAMMDCHVPCLVTEFHVHERLRDACFLHNFTLFAAAQKNCVYIYDHKGAEIHQLQDHTDPLALQFLPYHWLLASIGRAGWLKYQDTSTRQLISQHRTQLGPCHVLAQNPTNAVLHAGHANGVVTLWSPASSKYLVKLLCHKGAAIHSIAVDPTTAGGSGGHVMVTGGADKQVRVWDLRMYQELHSYYTTSGSIPTSLDISQRGILGIGHGCHATFWSADALKVKVKEPYMHHLLAGQGPVETLRFRPFEDVCGLGHAKGVSSIVIPGSGEPSLDTHEYNTNPMQDAKQRQEAEVRALLDKLRPEMIALDPDQVGGIEESDPHKRLERIQDQQEAANAKQRPAKKQKTKKRGRSKIQTKLRRKQRNVVDQNTLKLREAREKEKANQAREEKASSTRIEETPKEVAPGALKRFF